MFKRIQRSLLFFLLLTATTGYAQFVKGIHDVSVTLSDTKFGLPFINLAPIHPGIEVGATFFKRDRSNNTQSIRAKAGFIHHNILINAPYLTVGYAYQQKIKNTIGLSVYGDFGYIHAFYPRQGYIHNEETGLYEEKQVNEAFLRYNLGFELSYIKPAKINPIIRYEANTAGLTISRLISTLHVGVAINLN